MRRLSPARTGRVLVLAVPALLLGALAFVSGGFFPDATGLATVALLVAIVLWITLSPEPLAGVSVPFVVGAGLLVLYAGWVLLSSTWSDATGRAVLEYQRVLLYLAVFVLVGLGGRSSRAAGLVTRLLGLAGAVVVVSALGVWLLPESYPVEDFVRDRLNWPTSYWNATGLIAGLTAIWSLHLTSGPREHPVIRVTGAALVPLAAATLVLSVSRGAVAATIAGLVVYVVAARSRTLLIGLAATAPFAAGAVLLADATEGLGAAAPSAAAITSARETFWQLLACAAGAAGLRTLLLAFDRRALDMRIGAGIRRGGAVAAAVLGVAAVAAALALGAPERIGDAVDEFTSSSPVPATAVPSERLGRLGGNGRIDHWDVAIDSGYEPHPLRGSGAGTYELLWERDRPTGFNVVDGHSLYVEVLGELGIVGLALLVAALVAILGALAVRSFGPRRHAWAALLAAGVALAVHAGADWDWEMPALTAWLFGAGGLALAGRAGAGAWEPGRTVRIVAALACLGLAILPALVWRSQVRAVDAVQALRAGDCRTASDAALDAIDALAVRAEPYEILSYCQARLGSPELARRTIRAAIGRDPGNWELRYGQALVDGATGEDPRPAARAAARRNPRDERARILRELFDGADRRAWRRLALRAPLPLPVVRR